MPSIRENRHFTISQRCSQFPLQFYARTEPWPAVLENRDRAWKVVQLEPIGIHTWMTATYLGREATTPDQWQDMLTPHFYVCGLLRARAKVRCCKPGLSNTQFLRAIQLITVKSLNRFQGSALKPSNWCWAIIASEYRIHTPLLASHSSRRHPRTPSSPGLFHRRHQRHNARSHLHACASQVIGRSSSGADRD